MYKCSNTPKMLKWFVWICVDMLVWRVEPKYIVDKCRNSWYIRTLTEMLHTRGQIDYMYIPDKEISLYGVLCLSCKTRLTVRRMYIGIPAQQKSPLYGPTSNYSSPVISYVLFVLSTDLHSRLVNNRNMPHIFQHIVIFRFSWVAFKW